MVSTLSRSAFGVGVLAFALIGGPRPGFGQDDKNEKPEEVNKKEAEKKATQKLLDRAEEEYRIFFRRPTTVPQFWAAIKFEVNVGKFDLAGFHLKMLLQKEPAEEVDKELLKIEEVEGLASFVRLQTIRKWSSNPALQQEAEKNVKVLIDRVTAALDKHLSNADRLNKFIKNLEAPTIEERCSRWPSSSGRVSAPCRIWWRPYAPAWARRSMTASSMRCSSLTRKASSPFSRCSRPPTPTMLAIWICA